MKLGNNQILMEERVIFLNDLKTNYKIAGSGPAVLILHGWAGSSDSWTKVLEILSENGFKIICPDFPGFGKSKIPPKAWDLKDYTQWLKDFIEYLKLENFFLLGHSFGGRVAIKFSLFYPEKVKTLILCSSAGIKQKRGLKEKIIFSLALLGNAIFAPQILSRFKDKARHLFYKFLRNRDYTRADGTMKETMKKIIAEDLLPELAKIKVKTFIIWGQKDNIVPIKYAHIFKEKIENSKLEILPRLRHSPHLEAPEEFAKVFLNFFQTKTEQNKIGKNFTAR